MKKYGILILCYGTDGTVYIDYVAKLFDTFEQAVDEKNKAMQKELEVLGTDKYKIIFNKILDNRSKTVSEYQIREFEV